MIDNPHSVYVGKDLEELIPDFMENRRKDLAALRVALGSDDLEGLRFLGDRIKSVGGSFGFARIAAIGRLIEHNAKLANRAALRTLIDQYDRYLSKVQVVFK